MSTPQRPPQCIPTWRGHIETTKDALIVFQACFDGLLHHCSRRPHDRERNSLIVSGNVFVYEEATSGIKRWTDGIPWSPSRILTNFLIYRQLNSPFPPGEKKRATKRSARPSRPGEPYSTPTSSTSTPIADSHKTFTPDSPETPTLSAKREDGESPEKDANRGLVGSLVDSYEFKEGGLLKKTMTVTVRNVQHHLVSYYSLDDAKYNLKTPRDDARIKDIVISDPLIKQPKFKFPNLDDAGDGSFESLDGGAGGYPTYYQHPHGGGYATHYGYPYATSMGYGHAGVYAPSHPPTSAAYSSMAPSNTAYATHASSYAHPQYQYAYNSQMQQAPQYHSSYAQPYQGHQQPMQQQPLSNPSPVSQVKQEPGVQNGAPQYGYAVQPQSQPVPNVYAGGHTNGTSEGHEEEVVPASQPPQPQQWPVNNNYTAAWSGRPEAPPHSYAYRQSG